MNMRDVVISGLGLVVRRLQADGYLLATAADAVYTPGASPGSMDIAIDLKPGKLSVFPVLRVEGDASLLTKAAQEKITALAGQPYSEVRLENLRKELLGDLQQQGRFAAEVRAASTPLADAAGVVLGPWGRTLLLIGVVVSTFGYLSGMALAVPRALYAFARELGVTPRAYRLHHAR